jgi:hypothetical protein
VLISLAYAPRCTVETAEQRLGLPVNPVLSTADSWAEGADTLVAEIHSRPYVGPTLDRAWRVGPPTPHPRLRPALLTNSRIVVVELVGNEIGKTLVIPINVVMIETIKR